MKILEISLAKLHLFFTEVPDFNFGFLVNMLTIVLSFIYSFDQIINTIEVIIGMLKSFNRMKYINNIPSIFFESKSWYFQKIFWENVEEISSTKIPYERIKVVWLQVTV